MRNATDYMLLQKNQITSYINCYSTDSAANNASNASIVTIANTFTANTFTALALQRPNAAATSIFATTSATNTELVHTLKFMIKLSTLNPDCINMHKSMNYKSLN